MLVLTSAGWGNSPTEFLGDPLTDDQVKFLKDRAEALEEAEKMREAELRLLEDTKFCLSLLQHASEAQEVFNDCKSKLQSPIIRFYENWGKTEREGLLIQKSIIFKEFREKNQ